MSLPDFLTQQGPFVPATLGHLDLLCRRFATLPTHVRVAEDSLQETGFSQPRIGSPGKSDSGCQPWGQVLLPSLKFPQRQSDSRQAGRQAWAELLQLESNQQGSLLSREGTRDLTNLLECLVLTKPDVEPRGGLWGAGPR